MTVGEAKTRLEAKMRRRFDGIKGAWSVQDAEAARALLSHVRELEAKTRRAA